MMYKAFLLAALVAAAYGMTTDASVDACDDDGNTDCWSRPDIDCFGIYEPWSRVHCPLRCGFCGRDPPCEDKLEYCAQFEDNTCVDDNFRLWARVNCRKHCGLCGSPTPPANVMPGTTVSGGATVTATIAAGSTPTPLPATDAPTTEAPTTEAPTTEAPTTEAPTTAAPASVVTVATGRQDTIIMQGSASPTNGTCIYKGTEYPVGDRWNDGCAYECACMDDVTNRIVCIEKCTRWETSDLLTNCPLTQEENECCQRLECV